jgi:hypothetical protein
LIGSVETGLANVGFHRKAVAEITVFRREEIPVEHSSGRVMSRADCLRVRSLENLPPYADIYANDYHPDLGALGGKDETRRVVLRPYPCTRGLPDVAAP